MTKTFTLVTKWRLVHFVVIFATKILSLVTEMWPPSFVTLSLNDSMILKQLHKGILLHPQVVLQGSDDIASRAIELLKETFTSLGPKLRENQVQLIHLWPLHVILFLKNIIIVENDDNYYYCYYKWHCSLENVYLFWPLFPKISNALTYF